MWQTWNAVYYEPDKDGLLLDGIYPEIEALQSAGLLERSFCLRHWRQGPHVAVNLHMAPEHAEEVARHFTVGVQRYLAEHPSRAEVDPQTMLATHRRLAVLELDMRPLEPLRPDNSLEKVAYQPPFLVAGERAALAAETFLSDVSPLLMGMMLQTRESHVTRLEELLRRMLALTMVVGDEDYFHLSYRSHAEGYFNIYDSSGDLRQRLEAEVEHNRDRLLQLFQEIRAYVEGADDQSALGRWMSVVRRHFLEIESLFAAGALSYPEASEFVSRAQELGAREYLGTGQHNPFHQAVLSSDKFKAFSTSPRFLALRSMVNWHYAGFTLTGITPLERIRLCYWASRTVELAMGTNWNAQFAPK